VPHHAVIETRVGGHLVRSNEIQAAMSLVVLYLAVIWISWLCFLVFGPSPMDSLFEVVSAIGTVGLSTGIANPGLAGFLKFVLCIDMLMGRLEVVAVLVLVYPLNWFGRKAEGA